MLILPRTIHITSTPQPQSSDWMRGWGDPRDQQRQAPHHHSSSSFHGDYSTTVSLWCLPSALHSRSLASPGPHTTHSKRRWCPPCCTAPPAQLINVRLRRAWQPAMCSCSCSRERMWLPSPLPPPPSPFPGMQLWFWCGYLTHVITLIISFYYYRKIIPINIIFTKFGNDFLTPCQIPRVMNHLPKIFAFYIYSNLFCFQVLKWKGYFNYLFL